MIAMLLYVPQNMYLAYINNDAENC